MSSKTANAKSNRAKQKLILKDKRLTNFGDSSFNPLAVLISLPFAGVQKQISRKNKKKKLQRL
jgi:hypothetical protein